jgi:hypothetical protein
MLTPQKAGLLQAYLGSLPANLAARLAKAVEVDRLTDGAILPHEMILDGLRPILSRGAPQRDRTPTPLRLFCRPFEDILTSAPRTTKQKGRIARTSIMPVWNWVTMKLIPKASHAYVSELKSLLVSYRTDDARDRAILFWTDASAAIRDALSTEAGRKEVRGLLKDELAVVDAGEMALLLSAGAHVLELQDKLPKPIPIFTPDLIAESRAIYDRLIESTPDAAPYVVVIVMNRLARRWEALRLTVLISRKARDTLIASTDVGLAGDILFADLEALSQAVRSAKHPRFDADALVENVASFAELSSAIVKELELRRDGRWGQSLLKDRAEIGEVMDAFMERAPKEISNAFQTKRATRPVDPEKIERALRYATLIAGCKPFAAAASFAASLKDAQDEIVGHLHNVNDDALWDLRNADEGRRQIVQDQFALAVELTSILCGEDEAEVLRRRGRSSARPVAA